MDRVLYAFVERTIGSIARALPCTRGTTARVWCVETARGRFAVKTQCRGRAFAQERAALGLLVGDANDPWPQLVGSDPERLAIITTWLPGTAGDAPDMEAATRAQMFAAAGALRRRFDTIAFVDGDTLPLADALDRRMTTSLASLGSEVADRVRPRWRPHVFADAARRFCHRDFAPHNWLVSPALVASGSGAVSLLRCIDFGHARPDHPLVDFARALSPVWGRPDQRAALLAGYGRALAPAELDELRQLELLDAVATAAWGQRRSDTELATGGHAAMAAWLTEPEPTPT